MSILSRQSRMPRAMNVARGEEVAQFYPSELRPLVGGASGTSSYLAQVLQQEAGWIAEAALNPESAVGSLLADVRDVAPSEVRTDLRIAKHRISGLLALCDLAGAYSLEEVCGALTRFADEAVDQTVRHAIAPGIDKGRIPSEPGLTVLAMGKTGAYELNYSSDIDLIVLFDEARHDDAFEARRHLVRAIQTAMKTLSDVTAQGYVFRTDLRLRPDPSVTPLVQGVAAAESYYESFGRTWERAAYIKARAMGAGEQRVGEAFLDALTPFVWRRHLDFAAIQDTQDLRQKIREHKRLFETDLDGYNLKLGAGGIREIEFFAQSHQLIHGGRNPDLRLRGTVETLAALARLNFISDEAAGTLTDIYRRHRTREHRLQMMRDAQTHSLPGSTEGWEALAALMDATPDDLKAEIARDLDAVRDLCEPFFAPKKGQSTAVESEFGEAEAQDWLRYPALRSARAAQIFARLRPTILGGLGKSANPAQALTQFDRFLAGLPAGVQLFSLFEARPELVDLLVDICATAPALADYLGRNAQVLDAVLDGAFFAPLPSASELTADLTRGLERVSDYERCLDEARRWTKEQHFRIGVHLLRGLADAEEAGAAYAHLAQSVLTALYPRVVSEFERKYGPPPGRGAVVLGMGSLGAGRLHATSDLDLILIYDAQGTESSDGPRPLATRSYYARLTQALITAMTAQLPQGKLYEVDMRLRPSGRNGPVATSFEAFETYQRDEAWTWEHLALTRARVIAGPVDLAADVEAVRAAELSRTRDPARVFSDVRDMRARLLEARPGGEELDIKDGSGGLQAVELTAQTLALVSASAARGTAAQIAAGTQSGWISSKDAAALIEAQHLFWALRSVVQLVRPGAKSLDDLGDGGMSMASRLANFPTSGELTQALSDAHNAATRVIGTVLNPK